jgi:hypothetical protein
MAIQIGPFLGAIVTIMFLSWLFVGKRNILFDIAEAIFVGSAAGFSFVVGFKAVRDNAFIPLINGNFFVLIPILLGFVIYAQLSTRTIHIARIPISVIVGVGIGLSVRKQLLAGIVANLQSAIVDYSLLSGVEIINQLVILIAFISAFSYFVLTKDQTGNFGTLVRFGRIILMMTFGALLGATMMGGVGVIGGRVRDILLGFGII